MTRKQISNSNTEISLRIAQIRYVFCENDNRVFAEKLGKKESYTSQICNGSKAIGGNVLETILNAFPRVNANWLMRGIGNMILNDHDTVDVANSGELDGECFDIDHIQPLVFSIQEKLNEQSEILNQIIRLMAR